MTSNNSDKTNEIGRPAATPRKVAEWMLFQVEQQGMLRTDDVVRQVPKLFGRGFVTYTPALETARLTDAVKRAFLKISNGKVVVPRRVV